jgi:hypothetical protein
MKWFLSVLLLAGCSEAVSDDAETVGEIVYEAEVEEDLLNPLIVSSVDPGTRLMVNFFLCDDDLCAGANVEGNIRTPYGDVYGEATVEDIMIDDESLEGELQYDDNTFLLKGERTNEGAILDVKMYVLFITVGKFSLDRVTEEEINVEDL